ncbi:winged helix-turn-helix domain-containing protein [Yokenella regensburgei]|uniref:winged helix-turn-helix domain-containing protein n=1 Tax=Yokenella regensburgei TaxID=158877 RepID=UPI001432F4BE|nr:winged helix-turn-helix domain-containing protein [Yokenella regensburgei]QIU88420.1 hypothetical protein HEC60_03105 [Yokenella regensburgei]
MSYVIDSRVQINDDGMSSLGAHDTEVVLTATPMRLLTYLLNNPNRIISRDELFQHIWEERGLTPSGTSLSQYLSMLRKKFHHYGFDDSIIENVPKEGVRFNASVVSTMKPSGYKYSPSPFKSMIIKFFKKTNENIYWFLIGLIIIVVILHFTFGSLISPSGLQRAEWTVFGYSGSCELYFLNREMSDEIKKHTSRWQMHW